MYLIDTDTISLFLRRPQQHPQLNSRLLATPPAELWVSIVTAEELLQGAFGAIRRSEQDRLSMVASYAGLEITLRDLLQLQILPVDSAAEGVFNRFPPPVRRIGTRDCRVAASAISRGFVVVTRNARHFGQIPGVTHEDWTI